jgi:carbamoyltransferase
MKILGISCFYHDSAAALIINGEIISACEEERLTRNKHDKNFPLNSIDFCLKNSDLKIAEIDAIVFYDRPLVKFERIIETVLWNTPVGFNQFVEISKEWLSEGKLTLRRKIKNELSEFYQIKTSEIPNIHFEEHHLSHASSAFYASPFEAAGILCIDGVGEWATTSFWIGDKNKITQKWQLDFPHSLGLLYSAFTAFLGFKINDGEYKVMGLAPYGNPIYADLILKELIDIKEDGSFRLNMEYFNFTKSLTMTNQKFNQLFNSKPRKVNEPITQKEMDIASSIQKVTEQIILKICRYLKKEYRIENLCMAGGVALNCVANGKILSENIFKNIWIQPAAGDSGGAIGCALSYWYKKTNQSKKATKNDLMKGTYLGPQFSEDEIENTLLHLKANFKKLSKEKFIELTAIDLKNQKVVGWFQDKMEFGPRALGARSILGDPRSEKMQSILNLKIKFRESFRPFAPAILEDKVNEFFETDKVSPYMLFTSKVLIEKRSVIPAVTHLDYTARIQTVNNKTNSKFYDLISEFEKITGIPILINTSFNVRGEPIVCNPYDAYHCFMNTEMDTLVIGHFYLKKVDQTQNRDFKYSTNELDETYPKTTTKNNKTIKCSIKELRQFGLSMSFVFPLLGIVVIPKIRQTERFYWTILLGLLFLLITILMPQILQKPNFYFKQLTSKFGLIKTKIILTFTYFLILTPYGFILKLFINGQLSLKPNYNDKSYFIFDHS